MADILRALIEEHAYQLRVFGLLEKQVAALNQRKQPDYEVMHGVMRYMTQYPDRFHHPKEDLVFHKLVQRDKSFRLQVGQLLEEHVQIRARGMELLGLIDRSRADPATADTHVLRKSAHAYIGHLRRHMDVEELRLFPRAQQVLRAADWAEIDVRMKPVLDPLFEDPAATDFQSLRTQGRGTPRDSGDRRAWRPGWFEATAAMESASALLSAATKANARLARHQRETLATNAALVREVLAVDSLSRRAGLVRRACGRHSSLAGNLARELREVWSEAFAAACRPWREPHAR